MERQPVCFRFAMPILLLLAALSGSAALTPIYDVPSLHRMVIDGNAADWGARGFAVDLLCAPDGTTRATDDFAPAFRLGWNAQGLLLLVQVRDNTPVEYEKLADLARGDSVELLLSPQPGSTEFYHLTVSPGADPKFPHVRFFLADYRREKQTRSPLAAQISTRVVPNGYCIEALLPWENLGITPQNGREIACQLFVNDADKPNDRFRVAWYPAATSRTLPTAMHRLRLATKPSPPVRVVVNSRMDANLRVTLEAIAPADFAGKTAVLWSGQHALATSRFAPAADGRSACRLNTPKLAWTVRSDDLHVKVADRQTPPMPIGLDLEAFRAHRLMEQDIIFRPAVFTGKAFPPCDFAHPAFAEDLLGPYTLSVTYYDREYRPVTTAETPGRYGAVITITPTFGVTTRRFRTIFRLPDGVIWRPTRLNTRLPLPESLHADTRVLQEWALGVNNLAFRRYQDAFHRDNLTAILLAALYESAAGEVAEDDAEATSGRAHDRRWWAGLKRQLYGYEQAYPEPLLAPQPYDGPPAPVVRAGTPAEAGFSPEGIEKIDALCRQWAADSEEGFAVCLVRHGVAAFHRAYGMRDDRPMTVETKSWMASITKLIFANLLLMHIDRGTISLDAPIATYLPPFRNRAVTNPLTIRYLSTHTHGIPDLNGDWHWGDAQPDMEEMIAGYSPHLRVGAGFNYSGMGYALTGKIVEAVGGESLRESFHRHLLQPLGCSGTYISGTNADAMSIPLDLAKIGQLMLNRGAYGNQRFYRAETLQQIFPQPLTGGLDLPPIHNFGIGTEWYADEGLGEGAYGHGSASMSTLRIVPAYDLIIVMTRNAPGRNFYAYQPKFLQTVIAGLQQ